MDLKGKIVFVTGASAGIGAATALAFAAEGARLLLAARRAGKLAEVASQRAGAGRGGGSLRASGRAPPDCGAAEPSTSCRRSGRRLMCW